MGAFELIDDDRRYLRVLSLLWMIQSDTDWNQAATGRSSRGVFTQRLLFVLHPEFVVDHLG